MTDESWQEQYKIWKELQPHQLRLLDEGAETLSQSWLLNQMWCEWKELKNSKDKNNFIEKSPNNYLATDPWGD